MQRYLTIASSSNHINLITMSCHVQSSFPTFPSKNPISKPKRLDSHMFNFARHFKPWINFAIRNKQTRANVASSQQKEHHRNDREKIFHRPWNNWKYSMLLIPSLSESQTVCHNTCRESDNDPPKTHQIKALHRGDKLGFLGDPVAKVESIRSALGWVEVAAHVGRRVASEKDDENKESNEEERDSADGAERAQRAADVIQRITERHAIVVFSKSSCPFCKKTKAIFREASVRPQYVELDQRDDGEEIQDALLRVTGRRTVPQVFIYGAFVGGCSDLEKLKESGKLHKLLKQMPP